MNQEDTAMVIARSALKLLLLPGNLLSDLAGATAGDDRAMIRSLINMPVLNIMAVVALW